MARRIRGESRFKRNRGRVGAVGTAEVMSEPAVLQLSDEEGAAFFEAQVNELLGMSAEEFLLRWNGGEYDEIADDPQHRDILYLAMMGTGGR